QWRIVQNRIVRQRADRIVAFHAAVLSTAPEVKTFAILDGEGLRPRNLPEELVSEITVRLY
ncbi:MAG: hypothetical protein ACSW79_03575, partial [Eubacteriales bacterium]